MINYLKNIFAIALAAGIAWGVIELGQLRAQPVGTQGQIISGYPPGSTPVGAGQSATTGGISLNLGGNPGQFTYLCGLTVSPGSATAAITITAAIGNTPTGATWTLAAPVTAAGATGASLTPPLGSCIRSNAQGQAITLTVGALGTGGINQFASMWGYTL